MVEPVTLVVPRKPMASVMPTDPVELGCEGPDGSIGSGSPAGPRSLNSQMLNQHFGRS